MQFVIKVGSSIGTFVAQNWIPISTLAGGVIIGWFSKKHKVQIADARTKTTSTIAKPFKSFWKWLTGLFSKKGGETAATA